MTSIFEAPSRGRILSSLALAAGLGAAALATPAAAQTELRLSTFVPPVHIIYREIIEPWAQQVEEATNGEVKVTLFPSMQLGGSPPELIRQVQEGTVDMIFTLPGYTSPAFPRTQMIELPGLKEDGLAATNMMWDLLEAGLLDPEYDGLKVVALWGAEDAGLMTHEPPIRSLDDVQGLIMRSPSAAQAKQLERMGATPVAMPITEVYPQIERGVINGAMVPFTTILDFRLGEVANYFTISGPVFGRSSFVIVLNEDSYNRLSPEAQQAIDGLSGRELSLKATQAYLDRAAEAVESVRNAEGKEVIELPQEEQDRIRETLRPIIDEWLQEMEAAGIDGQAMLDVAGYKMGN
jgi:TRAP-type C4-dicarboxylate transport system substrate-binding protein